nr:HAD-IIIA family hydrolase [uncultured Algoriphagus sp.]
MKLVVSDVDGVLTDAGMYYSESGEELKKFNTHDGMGFELLRKAGIKTGIITSEKTQLVERRAQKLKVDYLYQGKRDGGKLEAVKEICKIEKISLQEVAYIGDDLNCIDLLKAVGLPGCPKDSVSAVKSIPRIQIMSTDGGKGAFREFAEYILVNKRN